MVGKSVLYVLAIASAGVAQTTTYQAESATLSGVTVGTSVAGFSGTGYIEGFDTSTDSITFTINSTTSQLYDLSIIYNGPYGDKYTYIVLNNAGGSQVSLPATTAWTTVPAGQVLLAAGSNSIQIQNNWGWYLIDAIALSPSAPRAPHRITPTPVTPNANSDASALLAYLASVYGSHILAGQQDPASLAWVTQNIGKTPAVLGVDFMDYTASRTSRGAVSSDVDSALAFAQQGGIVTFCWHWGAPAGLYDTPEHPWYSGFYTDATDFDVAAALADPAGANYTLLMQDIDAIAAQLKKLQSAGVPVIWRPLHEAEGGWFWWGARGPEPAKQLWRVLYERLTNVHGLRNLVWEWNSVAPEWYPGDDVVDLVSADTYAQGDHGPISATYNNLLALTNDTKIIAAAEIGSVMDPAQLQAYQADWVYFCVWSGDFIQGGTWNSVEFLKSVYSSEYVLTLDEIQGWKSGNASSLIRGKAR
ncbi:glycoside hydrolase family 26 protein [Trematosphaeria pertusa]|uniref:Glycoside hydrolase family 26 protein n=1 Tax=Trematosphaeria pertusa TaxID=390896 RepID=A0A6A6J177_9PLEO|nr:glycoside hydrolase family 26 protein [Trematosphaeria pertusa]KAF2256087.1 glycoside hydrolase family 26 protein [Trematosphaeria pertusa]